MKRITPYIICVFLIFLCTGIAPAEAGHKTKVLVIHSYHKGFTWTDGIDAALRGVLGQDPDIEVVSEHLDSKRWPLKTVEPYFLSLLEKKFARHKPDAIILSDNNALAFMQQHYLAHFAGIPVVFCGINNFQPGLIQKLGPAVTGVVEKTDPGGTVSLIQRLQPDLARLVIVTGMSATAREIKKETELALAGMKKTFQVIWKDRLSSQDLFQYLDTLSPKDAVLLIAFNRDRNNHYYSYEESAGLISSRSAAPVYGLWDFYLGTGIVGGKMVYSKDQGAAAARKCREILRTGQVPAIDQSSPNAVLIDFPALKHHGLKESNLPPQSLVFNKPRSFYQAHQAVIWSVAGFITVLVVLVITLAANIVRRKESDKKYKNLFDSSMDAIFLIDPDLRILDCNHAALKLFCIDSKEKFLALSPMDVSPPCQPDGETSLEKAQKHIAIAMEKSRHFFEWRHLKHTGDEFDASVLLSQTQISGKPVIQATVRDISDQKQAQEMLIQSEKMMSVGGLAAGMAHEINNPLAGMIQNATVLSNRLTNTTLPVNQTAAKEAGTTMEAVARFMERRDIPRMVSAITDSGARIASIVENMLSFARKGDATVSTYDPAELMDRVLELAATDFDLKKHYDFRKIAIEKYYETPLPMITCEGSKIQQVLLNILKNGAQAMSATPHGPAPRFILRLRHETAARMLRIEIEDNGPGMDQQTAGRIFEPFFTTKPIGIGTGLGLSVSYFIITENHKGTMTVSAEPGKGATFTIRLPLER